MVKNNNKAIITCIEETSYEDNTFWIHYEIGDLLGYEIVTGDKVNEFNKGDEIDVLENLGFDIPSEVLSTLECEQRVILEKPNVNVCSEDLMTFIDECRGSDNEMWFVEDDEIEEDEVFKIQEEVIQLDEKYKNLKISECITFGEDAAITIFGGMITKFVF